ncbi:hypothetical protein G6514_007460 [Epicoccum nigrum]|nr:hypothetical protein G6514_007460 [Epicoccum nigrum]
MNLKLASIKLSTLVNAGALLSSSALVGLSLAAIILANESDHVYTSSFPPGEYVWNNRTTRSVFIEYTRSNVIKTYAAAGLALFVGLQGLFVFGASFQRPAPTQLSKPLFGAAALSSIVAIASAIWSAASEAHIRKTTCSFDGARPAQHFTCSVENAACTAIRRFEFSMGWREWERILDRGCLGSRHARFLVYPIAVVSVLLAGLYAVKAWNKQVRADDENGTGAEREGLLRI